MSLRNLQFSIYMQENNFRINNLSSMDITIARDLFLKLDIYHQNILIEKDKNYINWWEIYVFLPVMILQKSQERQENFQLMYFIINRKSWKSRNLQ